MAREEIQNANPGAIRHRAAVPAGDRLPNDLDDALPRGAIPDMRIRENRPAEYCIAFGVAALMLAGAGCYAHSLLMIGGGGTLGTVAAISGLAALCRCGKRPAVSFLAATVIGLAAASLAILAVVVVIYQMVWETLWYH